MKNSRNYVYLSYKIADMRKVLLLVQQPKPNLDGCPKI